MKSMGLPNRWVLWIYVCLKSSSSSVHVNGSPTGEFQNFKGLRQSNLLSPLFFILVKEGLHIAIDDAKGVGLFTRVDVGRDDLKISHLLYVDGCSFHWRLD